MMLKLSINKNNISLNLFLLIMIEPPIFYHYIYIHLIYKFLQVVIFIIIATLVLKKKGDRSSFLLAVILFELVNFLITAILNPHYTFSFLYDCLYIVFFIIGLYVYFKKRFYVTLKSIFNIFFIYSILNCLLYILYPFGLISLKTSIGTHTNYYFLGLDNQFAKFIIPAMILMFVEIAKGVERNKIWYILLAIANSYTIFKTWSATAVVGYVIVLVGGVLVLKKNIIINKRMLFLGYILVFVVIVLFQNMSIPIFDILVENILGKSSTFSGRTLLWRNAMEEIAKSPIWGYGNIEGGAVLLDNRYSCHNIILQILMESGLLGFGSFAYIFYVCLRKKQNDVCFNQLWLGVFCIMVTMLMEVYQIEFLLTILLIIFLYDYGAETLEKKHE